MSIFSRQKQFLLCLFLFVALISQQIVAQTVEVPSETTIILDIPQNEPGATSEAEENSFSVWVLLRIVLLLLVVCAAIYGVMYLLKKSMQINASNDPYLKNLSNLPLSPSKSVQIIGIGSRAFVIGVSEQSIQLISELQDQELIDAMNLAADKTQVIPSTSFASILGNFLPQKILTSLNQQSGSAGLTGSQPGATPKSQTEDPAEATAAFLRQQRERLKNSGRGLE